MACRIITRCPRFFLRKRCSWFTITARQVAPSFKDNLARSNRWPSMNAPLAGDLHQCSAAGGARFFYKIRANPSKSLKNYHPTLLEHDETRLGSLAHRGSEPWGPTDGRTISPRGALDTCTRWRGPGPKSIGKPSDESQLQPSTLGQHAQLEHSC
jgi:hypothetical protein